MLIPALSSPRDPARGELQALAVGGPRRKPPGCQQRHLTAFVEIDNVTHAYGGRGRAAVDKLALSIGEGEFAAVVGPSGCGKSTLMKLVTGLQFPQAGNIKVAARKSPAR